MDRPGGDDQDQLRHDGREQHRRDQVPGVEREHARAEPNRERLHHRVGTGELGSSEQTERRGSRAEERRVRDRLMRQQHRAGHREKDQRHAGGHTVAQLRQSPLQDQRAKHHEKETGKAHRVLGMRGAERHRRAPGPDRCRRRGASSPAPRARRGAPACCETSRHAPTRARADRAARASRERPRRSASPTDRPASNCRAEASRRVVRAR